MLCTHQRPHTGCAHRHFPHCRKQTHLWGSNLQHLRLARVPVNMLTHCTNPPPFAQRRTWNCSIAMNENGFNVVYVASYYTWTWKCRGCATNLKPHKFETADRHQPDNGVTREGLGGLKPPHHTHTHTHTQEQSEIHRDVLGVHCPSHRVTVLRMKFFYICDCHNIVIRMDSVLWLLQVSVCSHAVLNLPESEIMMHDGVYTSLHYREN